ncbi:hypothetical protein Tco_1053780 [Tanacetum coccineum]|uniref:Legumain prodomain domain-containing protein n=1 Tax=Tanacetum coccineum TaxID=301880 RepID=A0ABQ5GUV9_9ASTR
MKSSLLGLVCFFLVILLAKVSGHQNVPILERNMEAISGHPCWEVLEAMANRNVTILYRNMEALTGIDNDLYQLWLSIKVFPGKYSYRSMVINMIYQYLKDNEYVNNKIDMVGSILFGPEKGHSILSLPSGHTLDPQCVTSSRHFFAHQCGFLSTNSVKHEQPFVNMCNHVGDKASIKEAIIAACGGMNNIKSYVSLRPQYCVILITAYFLSSKSADVDVRNPTTYVTPAPTHGSSDYCERVFVNGASRKVLGSFAKIYRVLLIPTAVISHDSHDKAQICIHGDASLGLCQCDKDDWIPLGNGLWSFVMSPYEKKNSPKIMFLADSDSVDISLDEVLQGWCYFFLAVGTALLLGTKFILSRDVDEIKDITVKLPWSCSYEGDNDDDDEGLIMIMITINDDANDR